MPWFSIQSVAQSLADVFFARNCVHCQAMVDEDSPHDFLCAACSREIIFAPQPSCFVCGYPFFGMLAGPQTCPHCLDLNPAFDQGKTLFLAKGPARSMIHQLKYNTGFYVLKDIERMIAQANYYLRYIENAILVPVPLHPVKLRERGYNQSAKVAETLEKATTGRSKVENLLIRTLFTQTQTRLNREQRHQNVKNAFALAPNAVVNPAHQYILVDDVFTTGSTLNACARTLRDAGATQLKVVTIGHG